MRKLLPLTPLLVIAFACRKGTATLPFASAAFERSIDGSALWTWSFTNKTADIISFTQTYYTGSLTGGKQTRWTATFSGPTQGVNMYFTFPGADSSASLPMGKDLFYASRTTDATPSLLTCAFEELGTVYTGSDSTMLDINIEGLTRSNITGTFSIKLYSPTATVMITQGHFTAVPLTLATQ